MIKLAKTSHRVVFGTVLAVTTIGAAQAITDSNFIYSSPKTGFYTIDSADMTPDNDGVSYTNGYEGISPATSDPACFLASLHLPNGVTMTRLAVWFKSSSGVTVDGQPTFWLNRRKFSDGTPNLVGFRSFDDNSGTRKLGTVPIRADAEIVNNAQYSYQLQVCLKGFVDTFYHGRLTYTYKTAGD